MRWSPRPNGAERLRAGDWLAALALHLALALALLTTTRTPPAIAPHAVQVRLVAAPPRPAAARPPAAQAPKPRPRAARAAPSPSRRAHRPRPDTPARPRAPDRAKAHRRPAPFDPFQPLVAPASPAAPGDAPASKPLSAPVGEAPAHDAALLSAAEIDRYLARMRAAIERAWRPPPTAHGTRDPVIELRLTPDGRVRSVRVIESSGDPALDASLLRAVHAAAPFRLPPDGYEIFQLNRIRFIRKR